MAVFFIGIDIFVRQVQSPAEAHIPVNDSDFPMIAVIEHGIETRAKGVEYGAFDACLLHLAVIMGRQCLDCAKIIVHQPHIHAGGSLFLHNIQYGIPHFSFLDNKIFHENKLLRFPKLPQQRRPKFLSQRKIFHLSIFPNRVQPNIADIITLPFQVGRFFLQGFPNVCAGHLMALLRLFIGIIPDALGLLFVHGFIAEYQIKNAAEDRENQNGDNPGNFIRGVVPFGDNPKDHN